MIYSGKIFSRAKESQAQEKVVAVSAGESKAACRAEERAKMDDSAGLELSRCPSSRLISGRKCPIFQHRLRAGKPFEIFEK